jgi:parvulin-like peptidyl-prolyl isomerase
LKRLLLLAAGLCLGWIVVAQAADNTPVATKDGKTFFLEDINIYWLRNLGSDGLLAYFEDMVLYQEGLKLNLRPTDAEMTDYIDNRMGRETYQQFIQLYSEHAVRQLVEVTLTSRKYEQYLRDKIRKENSLTVTEAEAKQFFLKNIELYHLPEGAYLSIISVDTKKKAEEVMSHLKAGQNFNDLAAKYNLDPWLRDIKGELGLYRRGDGLHKSLEDAGLALAPNKFSEIISGTKNFHILFCHQRSPEVNPSFEEVKDRVMQEVLDQKIDPLAQKAMNELMKREMGRFDIKADLFKPEPAEGKPAARTGGGAAKPVKPAGQ